MLEKVVKLQLSFDEIITQCVKTQYINEHVELFIADIDMLHTLFPSACKLRHDSCTAHRTIMQRYAHRKTNQHSHYITYDNIKVNHLN